VRRSPYRSLALRPNEMKLLVIGSGAREHAICWKLRQSSSVENVWCAPGNAGIARDAECVPLDLKDVRAAADLALKLGADLTIVGPEVPLVLGINDEFSRRGLAILGPSMEAAQLEGSKVFAKKFMQRHGIPTASVYGIFDSHAQAIHGLGHGLGTVTWPLVIKADGLCAGKGVLVTREREEASRFIQRLMDSNEFGDAGRRILVEEALAGTELSYIVLTDGKNFIPMAPARDHKRLSDGDKGPNTGGMGAYSTDDILPADVEADILDRIVRPTLAGLAEEKIPYCGFLYFGLMLTPEGPKVLEYNCRLGDPETETTVMRADFDFAQAFTSAVRGTLDTFRPRWFPGASTCVVIASEGYPGNPIIDREISSLEAAAGVEGSVVFHAATRKEGDSFYTTGGRVLVVSARGESLDEARRTAYRAVEKIYIPGSHYRRDIGAAGKATGKAAIGFRYRG
jgi:phosphoribosylamine--glycine ligase